MNLRVSSTLSALLAAVKCNMIKLGLFNAHTIYISQQPHLLANPPDDEYCIITVGKQKADQPVVTGAGNFGMFMVGHFGFTVRKRLALDPYPRDDIFITDPCLSLYDEVDKLIAALQIQDIVDVNGNYITAEPPRLLEYETAIRDNESGWGYLDALFEINYTNSAAIP